MSTHQIIITALYIRKLCVTKLEWDVIFPGDLKVEKPVVAYLPKSAHYFGKVYLTAGKGHQMLIPLSFVIGNMDGAKPISRLQNIFSLTLAVKVKMSRVEADTKLFATHRVDDISYPINSRHNVLRPQILKADRDILVLDILGNYLELFDIFRRALLVSALVKG